MALRVREVDPAEPGHEERSISSSCIMGERLKDFWEVDRVSDTVFPSVRPYNVMI